MSAQPKGDRRVQELIAVLIDRKLISAPQADIALGDAEVTGMTLDEVLVARGWVPEDVLHELAPWLKTDVAKPKRVESVEAQPGQSTDGFEQNLQKYRSLMDSILGDANK